MMDIEQVRASIDALIEANNQHLINVWELSRLIHCKVEVLRENYSPGQIDELSMLTCQLSDHLATLIVLPAGVP